MSNNNFLSIADLSAERIELVVKKAISLKAEIKKSGGHANLLLKNKSMAMIFDKSSLRTRLSFEVGMTQLGGHAVYLAPDDIKLGVRETVHDTAKVVSSMADIIIARVSSHADVCELAEHSSVPVINAMTDLEHPCQILADLQTIYEHFGSFSGIKLAYLGDADNNVTNSLALAAEILGMEMTIAAPKGYGMSTVMAERAPRVKHCDEAAQAVAGAHIIVTDTWLSAGKEADSAHRLQALAPFQVTAGLLTQADPRAVFMHCLPAYRGKEVAAEVIDGPQSLVFAEAENRLHAQKAIMLELLA